MLSSSNNMLAAILILANGICAVLGGITELYHRKIMKTLSKKYGLNIMAIRQRGWEVLTKTNLGVFYLLKKQASANRLEKVRVMVSKEHGLVLGSIDSHNILTPTPDLVDGVLWDIGLGDKGLG